MKALIALALLFGTVAHAQTAKVIALSPADAAEVTYLYVHMGEVDGAQKLNSFGAYIERKYLMDYRPGCVSADDPAICGSWKPGWENGFVYSGDFRFIAPAYRRPQ